MKTTKKAALVAASSALLLGLTVAQTVNADTYTVQMEIHSSGLLVSMG